MQLNVALRRNDRVVKIIGLIVRERGHELRASRHTRRFGDLSVQLHRARASMDGGIAFYVQLSTRPARVIRRARAVVSLACGVQLY